MAEETDIIEPVRTGIKVASEFVIPGGSNLLKGDFKQAGIHAALGLAARMFFGVPGLLLVSANSLSQAHTGRGLLEHIGPILNPPASTNSDSDGDESETKTPRKAARR